MNPGIIIFIADFEWDHQAHQSRHHNECFIFQFLHNLTVEFSHRSCVIDFIDRIPSSYFLKSTFGQFSYFQSEKSSSAIVFVEADWSRDSFSFNLKDKTKINWPPTSSSATTTKMAPIDR